jgi:hypothetical protein
MFSRRKKPLISSPSIKKKNFIGCLEAGESQRPSAHIFCPIRRNGVIIIEEKTGFYSIEEELNQAT